MLHPSVVFVGTDHEAIGDPAYDKKDQKAGAKRERHRQIRSRPGFQRTTPQAHAWQGADALPSRRDETAPATPRGLAA